MLNRMSLGLTALVGACALAAGAHASELLTNGDFETGDLSGWTVTDQAGGSGSWYLGTNGGGSPLNGFPTPTLVNGGDFNAQTDQGGPGSHTLSQSFFASGAGTYTLSFDVYGNDQSGAAPAGAPGDLDYNNAPNQHGEVNLIGPSGTVLVTYGAPGPDWTHLTFDLSSLITSAGVYTVAFSEVDNQLFYNIGLDNISLTGAAGVPEPASWALMILGFGGMGAVVRRRRAAVA